MTIFDTDAHSQIENCRLEGSRSQAWPTDLSQVAACSELELCLRAMDLPRRRLQRGDYLYRAGQSRVAQYLVYSGTFKTAISSADGRAKITGFHLRGDLLGLEAVGASAHRCDAIALDVGEVIEIPHATMAREMPAFQQMLTSALAAELRRDWRWMLTFASLNAEQRVITFLLDLSNRQAALGFSAKQLNLRMTRADIGSFLALQLETVTRAFSHLNLLGLIALSGRRIRIVDEPALRQMLSNGRRCPQSGGTRAPRKSPVGDGLHAQAAG